jgi:Uncharacterised nucleotidyltransferase
MHLRGYGPVKRSPKIPAYAWAVMDCLKLSGDKDRVLPELSEAEWRNLLRFSDRAQLTLPLAQVRGEGAPAWVKRRFERNLAQNALRWEKIKAAFNEYASELSLADIPYVLLKGFSHCPELIADPRLRVQYDLDLLFLPQDIRRAYDLAIRLGFEPLAGFDQYPTDHWPTMIRKTGWEWRGDYFDTEIPVSLELHFRFWDERSERFAPDGLEQFWERRQSRSLEGVSFTALHSADILGYACLHVLRHMLRGALRPAHVYELALFLDRRFDDYAFWTDWEEMHRPSLQRLETIVFGLASIWFDCRLPLCIHDHVKRLPLQIRRWLAMYSESPLVGLFCPNKDDIWLHWSLVSTSRSRLAIATRRLLPRTLPGSVKGLHVPQGSMSWSGRVSQYWAYMRFVTHRASHHMAALLPTVWSAFRWWRASVR